MKKPYQSVALICFVSIFLSSCDAFYLTRGVVTERAGRDSGISEALAGVAISAYYVDRQGNTGLVVNRPVFTALDGQYEIFFAGPPARLDRSVFLEFGKPGYQYKKVVIQDDRKDPDSDVSITQCHEKTNYQGCWSIDVILSPESRR